MIRNGASSSGRAASSSKWPWTPAPPLLPATDQFGDDAPEADRVGAGGIVGAAVARVPSVRALVTRPVSGSMGEVPQPARLEAVPRRRDRARRRAPPALHRAVDARPGTGFARRDQRVDPARRTRFPGLANAFADRPAGVA